MNSHEILPALQRSAARVVEEAEGVTGKPGRAESEPAFDGDMLPGIGSADALTAGDEL